MTSDEKGHTRSRAEERMIREFEKRGARRFRVAGSAEAPLKDYTRPASEVRDA